MEYYLDFLLCHIRVICHAVTNPFTYSFNKYLLGACFVPSTCAGHKDYNNLPLPSNGSLSDKCRLCIICRLIMHVHLVMTFSKGEGKRGSCWNARTLQAPATELPATAVQP